jgi:hypothetical protein
MTKQTQILLVAGGIAVVGGLYYWQNKKDASNTNTEWTQGSKTSAPQVKVVPEEVDKIDIKAKDKPEVVLTKTGADWSMTAPVQTSKVQKGTIDEVLNALKGVQFKDPIAKGQNYYADYDLTPEKAVHVVASKGGTPVADLWLGAQKSRGQMARVGSDDQIWSISGASAWSFDKAPKDFRDRKVWDLPKDQVASVDISDAKGALSFVHNDTPAASDAGAAPDATTGDAGAAPTWSGTFGGKPIKDLTTSKVDDLVNAFALGGVLNADDFGDGKSDAETGLASPDATTLDFKTKDGASHKIVLGKTDGTKRYARKEGDPTVYLLAESPSSWAESGLDKFVPAPTAGDGGDAGSDGGKGDAKK